MQSALTAAQKASIQSFVTANTGIATVSCVGYTGYNYLGESAKKIKALAKSRATNACAYAASLAGANYSLDSNTAPEYGFMGTINAGQGAYFSHWNTAADDTGTSYQLGDHLGHIPDGTTVTLYAIPATG
mgnify:CR=1 FL=1